MYFWPNLILFVSIVLLFLQRKSKNKDLLKIIGVILFLDLAYLFYQTRWGLPLYVVRVLIYWSPSLVLVLVPYYGYKNNWRNVKKNSFSLFLLLLGALFLTFLYNEIVVTFLNSLSI